MRTAKKIITKEVITVKKDFSIKELSRRFVEKKVNGMPVVENEGKLIGVVTQSDLVEQSKNLHIPAVIALFDALLFLESEKKLNRKPKS